MNIGLYFGSFNPIHNAHLLIASNVAESGLVDKIWFVVSPQNPLKPSHTLLNEYNRLFLVNLAIENDNRFKAVDIEFR
ncbi:MAG: nicotinic acid mononucleotide adenylyltransferase, partial [Chitinophagaceae bacterium]|nr:nicotinic acid mononucleotide adenylyltransferase [Chitinophagaceae bacterium]